MSDMVLKIHRNIKHGTNILDFDVPKELDRTVSMGIDYLDDVFGGEGPTPSQVTLFTGMPGAGKSTLMFQTADSITRQGHMCLYNGNEENAVQMRKTVRRLGLQHGFFVGNERKVQDVIKYAKELQRKAKGKKAKDGSDQQVVLIVDSLQTLDDGKYSNGHTTSNTPLRVTELITEWCKTKVANQYGIAIIIGHVTKSGDYAGKGQILHAVDARLSLRIDNDPKSDTAGKRLLEMGKNRFGSGACAVVLEMTSRGLVEDGRF